MSQLSQATIDDLVHIISDAILALPRREKIERGIELIAKSTKDKSSIDQVLLNDHGLTEEEVMFAWEKFNEQRSLEPSLTSNAVDAITSSSNNKTVNKESQTSSQTDKKKSNDKKPLTSQTPKKEEKKKKSTFSRFKPSSKKKTFILIDKNNNKPIERYQHHIV